MKYLKEITIIFGITLIGELLNQTLPLPVPAGVYGLFILLLCLCLRAVKLEDISATGNFLLDTMPLMFIPAGVGLLNNIEQIKGLFVPLIFTITVSTVFVMVVTGKSAQYIIRKDRKRSTNERSDD